MNARSVTPATPPVRILAAFENGKIAPFTPGDGIDIAAPPNPQNKSSHALRIQKGYAIWDGAQDWTGYDFFKADVFNPGDEPVNIYMELRDQGTTDYWTAGELQYDCAAGRVHPDCADRFVRRGEEPSGGGRSTRRISRDSY